MSACAKSIAKDERLREEDCEKMSAYANRIANRMKQ